MMKHFTHTVVLWVFFCGPVLAQQHIIDVETLNTPGNKPVEPGEKVRERLTDFRGIEAGSLVMYPAMVLSSYYDDNIYVTETDEVEDVVLLLSPSLLIESDWQQHQVRAEVGADIARYDENDRENHEHYRTLAEGRYDIDPHTNLFGGVYYSYETEDRESPDDFFGEEPTNFYDTNAYVGGFKQVGRVWVRAGVTYEELDFEDVSSILGAINNDDRDRKLYTGGVNLGYLISPNLSAMVQMASDYREYPNGVDDFDFDRDSEGYRLMVGGTYTRANIIEAEFYIGHMKQMYQDPELKDVSALALSATVDLFPTPSSILSFYADRIISETTTYGASSYLNSVLGTSYTYNFSEKLSAEIRASLSHLEFQGIDRNEDYPFFGASARYLLGTHYYLQADYALRLLDSPIPGEDFQRNQIFLRFGAYL